MHFAVRAVCPRRKQTFTDVKHNSLFTGESYTMIRITIVKVLVSGGTIKCPRIHYLYQKYLYVHRYHVQLSPPGGPGFAEQTELRHGDSSRVRTAQHLHPSLPRHLQPSTLSVGRNLDRFVPNIRYRKKMRMRRIHLKYIFSLQGPSLSWTLQ